jgi:hypothetical protein
VPLPSHLRYLSSITAEHDDEEDVAVDNATPRDHQSRRNSSNAMAGRGKEEFGVA